ncbi:MAG: ATP-binding cassette domain-containing protein [Gammaproteobacteria bacterium]
MTAALRLEKVSIALAERVLIPTLDLLIAPGEIVTVMGPSGAGKSTLLAYLSGTLDRVFSARGRVFLGAEEVTGLRPEQRRIGILFQDDLLFPHLSVGGNLAFGLSPAVRGAPARRARIDAFLAEAGLAGFAARDPATLSGGQRARIALLRSLIAEPKALLLDEPFNKLDAALRADFRRFVFDHTLGKGLPVLMVTHDAADAEAAGGRLILLSVADG